MTRGKSLKKEHASMKKYAWTKMWQCKGMQPASHGMRG
jgi:hypothetical protein